MPKTRYEKQPIKEILRQLEEAEPDLYRNYQSRMVKVIRTAYKRQLPSLEKREKYFLAAACKLLQDLAEKAHKRECLKQSLKYTYQAIRIAKQIGSATALSRCLGRLNQIATTYYTSKQPQQAMQHSRHACELATYCSAKTFKTALTLYCNAFYQLKRPADIAPAQEDAQALIKEVHGRLQSIKDKKPGLSGRVKQCESYLMQMKTRCLNPDILKTMTVSDPSHSNQSLAQVMETFRAAEVENSTPDDMDRFIRLATPHIKDPDTSQAIKAVMMNWLTNTERDSWNRYISGCKRPSPKEKLHRIERLNKLATLAKTCEKPLPSSPAITCTASQAAASSRKRSYRSMSLNSEG